jgi:hypothetical protein
MQKKRAFKTIEEVTSKAIIPINRQDVAKKASVMPAPRGRGMKRVNHEVSKGGKSRPSTGANAELYAILGRAP